MNVNGVSSILDKEAGSPSTRLTEGKAKSRRDAFLHHLIILLAALLLFMLALICWPEIPK